MDDKTIILAGSLPTLFKALEDIAHGRISGSKQAVEFNQALDAGDKQRMYHIMWSWSQEHAREALTAATKTRQET